MPIEALGAVFTVDNLLVILLATLYGTFVGAMPGLTATMAVAPRASTRAVRTSDTAAGS